MTGELDDRAVCRRVLAYGLLSLLAVAPILGFFYWPAGGGLDVTGHPIGRDFINVWVGPQVAFTDGLAALFDLDGYHDALGAVFGRPVPFHNWGYPLFTLPAFWPLAQLPYGVALAVWTGGLFALFAGVTLSQVAPGRRLLAGVALALAPACLINAVGGQNGFLTATLLLGGVLAIDRRPWLAGVLFGLLTYKPHLGVVVPFVLLALGAWRPIVGAAATALALYGGTALVTGLEPWRQWLEVTGAYQVSLLEDFRGYYTYMMASVLAAGRMAGLSYPAATALQIAVSLPVLAVACWAVRHTTDPARRAFVVAAATPLVTPYAFNYDLTALAAALVWVLVGRLPLRAGSAAYLVAWITPTALMGLQLLGIALAPLALLALFAVAVREAAGTGRTAVDGTAEPRPAPLVAV